MNNKLAKFLLTLVCKNVEGKKTFNKEKQTLNFRCPICGDSKKSLQKRRGWLCLGENHPYFKCYNECGMMSYENFLKKAFKIEDNELAKLRFETDQGSFNKTTITVEEKVVVKPKQQEFHVLSDWKPYDNSYLSINFLKKRKILEAPFIPPNWQFYISKNRIIIPWIIDNKIKYWQSRQLIADNTPKYLFPKDTSKPIFGIDRLDPNFPYIFLNEGVFNTIWVKNGCCLGSCNITESQIETLKEYSKTYKIVWMLDNQYIDSTAKKKLTKFVESSESHDIFLWPKSIKNKDVNDYVIETNDKEKFANKEFLLQNTHTPSKAKVMMMFGK